MKCDLFLAERRAQLARSRSRQNVLSPDAGGSSTAPVREINFDPESSLESTPVPRTKQTPKNANSNSKSHRNGPAAVSARSEAEELLERLRAL